MSTLIQSSNLGSNLILPGAPKVGVSPSYLLNDTTIATTQFVQTLLTNNTANLTVNIVKIGASPNGYLYLTGGNPSQGGIIQFYSPSNVRQGIIYSDTTGASTDTGNLIYIGASHWFQGGITSTGNITTISDSRLKTNVHTIKDALNKVSKLRGVTFDKDNKANIGVIAQEIQSVFPEAVSTDDKGYLSVSYGNLVGVLIEAIKELKLEIDILKGDK